MVDLKFFGEAKKATCVKRQENAQKVNVDLIWFYLISIMVASILRL